LKKIGIDVKLHTSNYVLLPLADGGGWPLCHGPPLRP